MPNLRRLGAEAEDRAAEFLREKGLTIVTRRFKGRRGEIDLVCMDGECLVFVEVRQRRGAGAAEESIGARKASLVREAALEYVARAGLGETRARFDVVAIDEAHMRHHEDVFADNP